MSDVESSPRRHAPLAMLVAFACVCWLFLAAWGAAQYRQATHRGPVLHAPMSVAVDASDGTIYCASGAGRVHKYGPKGEGRGAFPVETGGAAFSLASDGKGRLAVAIEGSDNVRVYDEGGRVIDQRDEDDAYESFVASEAARAGGQGVVLEDGALIERTAAGTRVLVSRLPFPLSWFAVAPWTLVLSLMLSTFGLMASFVWPFLQRSD